MPPTLTRWELQLGVFRSPPERKHPAEAAAAVGMAPLPRDATVLDIAAWTGVARTLLNLDELLVRE